MPRSDLITAALYLFVLLVWAIITARAWAYRQSARPRSQLFRLAPLATGLITLHGLAHLAVVLLPPELRREPPLVMDLAVELSLLASMAVGLHMLRLMRLPEERPSRGWLLVDYGGTTAAGTMYTASRLLPGSTAGVQWWGSVLLQGGFVVLFVLVLRQAVRAARPGSWGPEFAGEVRSFDLKLVAIGFFVTGVLFLGLAATGRVALGLVVLEVGSGLTIAAPMVLQILGFAIPELVVAVTALAATAAVLVGRGLAAELAGPPFRPLLDVATVLILALVLAPGHVWLRARIYRVVLRRSLRQHQELREFLHTLSPELGTVECCRRALAELVRVRQLNGAAIILRDGEAVVHGTFNLEPLLRVWPRGAAVDALPTRSFDSAELRELPFALREALTEANVGVGAAPILSPRRRWGHLFMNTGFLRSLLREDDMEEFRVFVAQLALLLDGAHLLARAVAVERSLAHAEKLAAIGETAARIAHEMRNPVTAARSLAQQLCRAGGSPEDAEAAALILTELERVERQVAALLRFARREEFRFEAVDIGALARDVVGEFGRRLAVAGVAVQVDCAHEVVARADREKLRQVLINLIENALDALSAVAGRRHLSISVTSVNGTAGLRVADSGPGVPADALPRLFEPFFSLKEKGTGLGLAIVRRTVEAHGGRIEAVSEPKGGMTVQVELPLAGGA